METFSRDWGFVFKVFSCKRGKVFVSVFQRLTWVSLRQCHLRLSVLSLVHSWRRCWSSWSHCDCSWWPRKIGPNRHAAVVLIKHWICRRWWQHHAQDRKCIHLELRVLQHGVHITPKKWNYCTDAEHHKGLFVFPMTKESLSLRHLAITFFIRKLILEMSFHWLVRRMNCPNPASSCPSLGERALDLSRSVRRGCSFVTVPILGCLPKDHPEHSKGAPWTDPATAQVIIQDKLTSR